MRIAFFSIVALIALYSPAYALKCSKCGVGLDCTTQEDVTCEDEQKNCYAGRSIVSWGGGCTDASSACSEDTFLVMYSSNCKLCNTDNCNKDFLPNGAQALTVPPIVPGLPTDPSFNVELTCACVPETASVVDGCASNGAMTCMPSKTACGVAKFSDKWMAGCLDSIDACSTMPGNPTYCKACRTKMCNKVYLQGGEQELGTDKGPSDAKMNGAVPLRFFAPAIFSIILAALA